MFINSWSQTYALYCLILLFQATKDEMAEINPLAKFLCVKAVVFFSFWQSIAIVVLVQLGVIRARADMSVGTADKDWDLADVSKGIQDFAICVEMFVAAVAHQYAFPVEDYPDVPPAQPMPQRVVDVFDLRDMYADVVGRADAVGGKVVRAFNPAERLFKLARAVPCVFFFSAAPLHEPAKWSGRVEEV